jgi:hypothetical protein
MRKAAARKHKHDDLEEVLEAASYRGRLETADVCKKFCLAGNATVTLVSRVSQTRYTYRVRLSEDKKMYFVSLLTGESNEASYSYLGHIFSDQLVYWHGRKSKIGQDATSAKAFAWFWAMLMKGKLPDQLEVWHEDTCGRCGRKLTVPESIAHGFGPECYGKMGGSL